jgi:hypothetical protein
MSSRVLWVLSVPLALLGWAGVILLTAMLPVSPVALIITVPVITLALAMTAAPPVWVVAHRLGLPAVGERPAVALRVAAWFGLWAAIGIGLRLLGAFSWLVAITLAVIFGLVEAFLQQWTRR